MSARNTVRTSVANLVMSVTSTATATVADDWDCLGGCGRSADIAAKMSIAETAGADWEAVSCRTVVVARVVLPSEPIKWFIR